MSLCVQCPVVTVATERALPAAVVALEPLVDLLCVGHLRVALAARAEAQAKAAAAVELANRFPPCLGCGRPLFLVRSGRAICERCRLGLPKVTVQEVVVPPSIGTPIRELAPMPTCYGLGGTCPNKGRLYAGGSYCGEPCKPPVPQWLESR